MVSPISQLKKHGIRPKKRLGQNFLLDEDIQEKIVSICNLTRDESVVEIGAGLGALTMRLAPRVREVFAVELDGTLANLLKARALRHANVSVINQDILSFDFSHLADTCHIKLKVLGNIPYNISSPLVFKLLDNSNFLSMAVLMFQKEVADRIVAEPGTKNYGVLSVFCQVKATVTRELVVPKHHFYPEPKVDSAVVRFTFSDTSITDIEDQTIFKRVVKAAFAQRRKMLKNTLKSSLHLDIPFEKVLSGLEVCGIDPQRRGETLSLDEIKQFSNYLTEQSDHSPSL